MREATDRVVGVVHRLRDTAAFVVVHLDLLGLAAYGGVDELELAGARDDAVLGAVLVTEGVAADDDGFLPAGDETGDGGDDDGFTEDGASSGFLPRC